MRDKNLPAPMSIAAGNLLKLLQVPFVVLGGLLSFFVPRDPERWVFGSGSGVGEGALQLERAARERGYATTWIVHNDRDESDAHALGIRTARGVKGFFASLRAGVVVFTHGFGDVNRFGVRGAFVVNLWHGIPLKHLHLDAPGFLQLGGIPDTPVVRAILRAAHRSSARRIKLFPVASERVASRIRSGFGLHADVVQVLGDPRVDPLYEGTESQRSAFAEQLIGRSGVLEATTTILYAPTWRDGQRDPAIPGAAEWDLIADWLAEHDARLLVRSHPLGAGSYDDGPARSPRIALVDHALIRDVTRVLPSVDILVTDFSSIAYDFAGLGRPVLFLAPDVTGYAALRGLYDDFDAFSGRHVARWDQLLAWLDELALPEARAERQSQSARLVAETQEFRGGSARRVLAAIDASLGRADERQEPGAAASIRVLWRDGAHIRMRGTIVRGHAPVAIRIRGDRAVLDGELEVRGNQFTASLPLRLERWGTETVLPSGEWQVEFLDAMGARLRVDPPAVLPDPEIALEASLQWCADAASVALIVAPPLAPEEQGARAQRALERAAFAVPSPQLAVFFESFFGSSASCNPLGIDRALARLRPDVTRYWSTRDASVPVPTGAIRVIEGTHAWWRARASARVLVVNDWLRKRTKAMPHQRILQTWHGTPLKRLALDRPSLGLRSRIAAIREGRRWDVMLSQNPHSTRVFRSAYAFQGAIWELGYPRSDALVRGNAAAMRRRLGICAGQRVVLYAPTWRDDREGVVDFIELERLQAMVPDDVVVLVRGHSRTIDLGRQISFGGVIDVTSVPDTASLLLVADILVTDYSSVMFDFAATERPIIFAVPDLDDYRDRLRGFTFDMSKVAPGPFVTTTEDLAREINRSFAEPARFAEERAAWKQRFTPRDDGDAGERVVQRLIDVGMLAATPPSRSSLR